MASKVSGIARLTLTTVVVALAAVGVAVLAVFTTVFIFKLFLIGVALFLLLIAGGMIGATVIGLRLKRMMQNEAPIVGEWHEGGAGQGSGQSSAGQASEPPQIFERGTPVSGPIIDARHDDGPARATPSGPSAPIIGTWHDASPADDGDDRDARDA
ncbi:hypothetical protein [Lysinibacter cavernae]|uniref:Uncharacterized protein n=1 Tax=Lysinibacter cavernae TaxID=1640652 RepID=A0A7X5R340_9MICO|nr:hypothetical protein [Lysinibacter cavernae]NIH54739.1 hypothetical protein [Lysinibacter cavernae]